MSCWSKMSPFQMANTLILMVAIPFLIIMIIIYILFGLVSNKSGSCEVLCCYEMEGLPGQKNFAGSYTTEKVPSDAVVVFEDYKAPPRIGRSLDFPMDEESVLREALNPAVGALVQNLYKDDDGEKVFKCPVAIIDEEWAVTVDRCVGRNLSVRVHSNYWSKRGSLRRVEEFVFLEKRRPSLVLVRFSGISEVQPVEMANMTSAAVQSFSWIHRLRGPLAKREKFDKLNAIDVEFLQKDDCGEYGRPGHVSCYITRRSDYCGRHINAPMMDGNNNFVGVHLETVCEDKKMFSLVFYLHINDYISKIKTIVN